MKYTDDEAFASIMQKGKELKRTRNKRKTRLLSVTSCVLLFFLAATVVLLPDRSTETPVGSVYGSFLLSMEAGGYVLVGVLAFALGAALTLLCLHLNKLRKSEKQNEKTEKNTED